MHLGRVVGKFKDQNHSDEMSESKSACNPQVLLPPHCSQFVGILSIKASGEDIAA